MNTQRQYKFGAALSYLTILINVIMGLAFRPLMKGFFGDGMLGVYDVIGGFVGSLAIMDFGLGNAVIRYAAKYRAENNQKGLEGFLGMVVVLYTIIGAAIVVIGAIVYHYLPQMYQTYTPEQMDLAKKLFLIALGNLTLSMLLNIFPGVMSAFERFVFMRVAGVIRLILRIILLAVMLSRGTDLVQILLLDTSLTILVTLCYAYYVFFRLRIHIRWQGFDRALLRTIFSYSVFIFLNMVMEMVYWRVDGTLVSMIVGASAAFINTTSGSIVNYFMEFSSAISGMFLPRAVQMVTREANGEKLTDLMIRVGRLQLMIIMLVVIGFAFTGYQFFALWLADENTSSYYAIVLMLMLALVIPMIQNVAISITQAMNKHGFRAVMLAIISVLNIAISVYLIHLYGPVGAAVGTVLSLLIGNVLISNWYYQRKIGLNIPRFFRETLRGTGPALLLIMAVSALTYLMPQTTWLWLFLRAAVIVVVYVVVMIAVGMNTDERDIVFGALRGARRRLGATA